MLLHCARRHPPLNSMENGTHFKTAQTQICCCIQISLSFCSYVLALSTFGKHSSDSICGVFMGLNVIRKNGLKHEIQVVKKFAGSPSNQAITTMKAKVVKPAFDTDTFFSSHFWFSLYFLFVFAPTVSHHCVVFLFSLPINRTKAYFE